MTTLTNEEIDSIWCKLPDCTYEVSYADQRRFAREVIAADRAKQAEQEPVSKAPAGWMSKVDYEALITIGGSFITGGKVFSDDVALYATPLPKVAAMREALESIIGGALFDFLGVLTSQPGVTTCSISHDAAQPCDQLIKWANLRGLPLDDVKVQNWQAALAAVTKETL